MNVTVLSSYPSVNNLSTKSATPPSLSLLDRPITIHPQTFPLLPGKNIQVVESSGESCPLVFCHMCGRRVKDARLAGVVWTYTKAKRSGFRVLCKDAGTGNAGFQGCLSDITNRRQPWMEYTAFIGYLLYNTNVRTSDDWEDVRLHPRFDF